MWYHAEKMKIQERADCGVYHLTATLIQTSLQERKKSETGHILAVNTHFKQDLEVPEATPQWPYSTPGARCWPESHT